MGQVQGQAAAPEDEKNPSSANSSLDSLIAVEEKAQRAPECPCIAHLRTGPCGFQFSDAFLCFLKSNAPEKGSDCVRPFVALQSCIKANADAFSEDILEDDEIKKEEKPSKEYKVYPPLWSVESKKSKQKS